ncbi:MAG: hypothetical protein AAF479_00560 [Pseudomonadota bacterium]
MSDETTIVGGNIERETVSEEITRAVRSASAQIDRIDRDPLIRLALARVTIRSFAQHIAATFPEDLAILADEFDKMADLIREDEALEEEVREASETEAAAETALDGETDAEDRQPVSEAGRRRQADPERSELGSARRKSPRNNGPQRIGKEHTVLRVGGA